jgi:hypothetical protein
VTVIVSESTAREANDFAFVDLGEGSLKGKSGGTRIFALHSRRGEEGEGFAAFQALHGRVIAAARADSPELGDAVEAAEAHPIASRYGVLYKKLLAAQEQSGTVMPQIMGEGSLIDTLGALAAANQAEPDRTAPQPGT